MTPSFYLIVAVVSLSLFSTPGDAVAGETAEPEFMVLGSDDRSVFRPT
jgi:hypothetical protein